VRQAITATSAPLEDIQGTVLLTLEFCTLSLVITQDATRDTQCTWLR